MALKSFFLYEMAGNNLCTCNTQGCTLAEPGGPSGNLLSPLGDQEMLVFAPNPLEIWGSQLIFLEVSLDTVCHFNITCFLGTKLNVALFHKP